MICGQIYCNIVTTLYCDFGDQIISIVSYPLTSQWKKRGKIHANWGLNSAFKVYRRRTYAKRMIYDILIRDRMLYSLYIFWILEWVMGGGWTCRPAINCYKKFKLRGYTSISSIVKLSSHFFGNSHNLIRLWDFLFGGFVNLFLFDIDKKLDLP